MKEENTANVVFNAEEEILNILPKAGMPESGLLAMLLKTKEDAAAMAKTVGEIKRDIALPEDIDGDYIIAKVLLNEISLNAAQARAEVLISASAVAELCGKLALDGKFYKLLLNAYASPSAQTTFLKKWGELSESFETEVDFNSKEAPKIIDSMIEEASKTEETSPAVIEENLAFIKEISKEKKISFPSANLLTDYYSRSCSRALKPVFEAALAVIKAANPSFTLAEEFAARVVLMRLTADEAAQAAALAKEIKYNILPDDLQLIAFKYLKFKTPQEISATLETILKRLPYADYPEENLYLAFKIMTQASGETLEAAEKQAAYDKGQKLFLRSLSANKYFTGYEDELTLHFYGKTDKEGVEEQFVALLRKLPYNKDIYENADIAIKVLLGRLPEADAENQALFRKDNKVLFSAGTLESEAVESYLGTKDRAEILEFFRDRLSKYDFWKNDDAVHGFALSLLVGELNGNMSEFAASLGLDMLQKKCPEQSVEMIIKSLPEQNNLNKESILSAYEKFYSLSSDHEDAAKRVINMFQ